MVNDALETFLLQTVIPIRLSCITPSGWPIVLSLWYLYQDGYLYCATPQSAKVVHYLTLEPRCGYEIAADLPPYCGVRGRALAFIDHASGDEMLEKLMRRYLNGIDNPLAQKLLSRTEPEVAIRVELQSAHTWNFSRRMTNSSEIVEGKICP